VLVLNQYLYSSQLVYYSIQFTEKGPLRPPSEQLASSLETLSIQSISPRLYPCTMMASIADVKNLWSHGIF